MSSKNDNEPHTSPIILTFHKLLDHISYGVSNYSPKRFEKLIILLQNLSYKFISINEFEKAGERDILLTFDDAYAHLVDVLPSFIKKYNIKPLIFIPTKYIGKPNKWDYSYLFQNCPHMTTEQIKKLSALGVDFGSHSYSHKRLDKMNESELENELIDSKETIESLINKEIIALSYPFGRCSQNVTHATKSAGYKYGFTMKFPDMFDDNLSLGRIPIYSYDNLWTIRQKLVRGMFFVFEEHKSKMTTALSAGTDLLNRFRKL